MGDNWAKQGSGVGKTKPGKRPQAARPKRKSAKTDRGITDPKLLFPVDKLCAHCSTLTTDDGGYVDVTHVVKTWLDSEPTLTRERFCSPEHMAAKTAERGT